MATEHLCFPHRDPVSGESLVPGSRTASQPQCIGQVSAEVCATVPE